MNNETFARINCKLLTTEIDYEKEYFNFATEQYEGVL